MMYIHRIQDRIKNASRNIGTMIGNPLEISQNVGPYKTGFHRTFSSLQAQYMFSSQRLFELIHYLL